MPRKQNGFGNPKSLSFKSVESRTDKGKKQGAFGQYPSNRRYGTSVQRTVIEQYNLDSDWSRWRKGYEYYNQGAYLEFTELETILYQGTADATPVLFTGERFATKNADSHTHYSVKREVTGGKTLGKITQVFNSRRDYPENYSRREIVAQVEGSRGANKELLKRAIGDRVTDGKTAANIINVLDTNALPSTYFGKTLPSEPARLEVTFPKIDMGSVDPQSLVGEVLALQDVRVERPISASDEFIDGDQFFAVKLENETGSSQIKILDAEQGALPPSLLDIAKLDALVDSSGSFTFNATYVFEKDSYQRFYGSTYLVADRVKDEVGTISYAVLPFTIQAVTDTGTDIRVEAVPFMTSVQMFSKTDVGFLIFNDKSFTTTETDLYDGEYYHKRGAPGEDLWKRLNTDVDPWMDEVFVDGGFLTFADVYACSCPDYLHALLRMPQSTTDGGQTNRQKQAPLPTAQGMASYKQLGLSQVAITAASWETREYRTSHRMCKHTVASNFIDRIKVVEPKGYPTIEAREQFEEKLEKDIREVAEEFSDQLRRSEITTIEVIAALSSALNFDEVELANVILNSRF